MNANQDRSRVNPQARAEAVEWLIAFSEGDVDTIGREQFNTWLLSSTENVRAYLRVSAFWLEAERISPEVKGDIDALVARAAAESSNVIPVEFRAEPAQPVGPTVRGETAAASSSTAARRPRARFALAASLAAVLAGIGALAWYAATRPLSYATGIGEQRTVTLPDGSTVVLNAQSRIEIEFTKQERSVELSKGQALFTVAHNRAVPFTVHTDGARVTAVGTQFDVDRKSGRTVVTVIEGSVAVTLPDSSSRSLISPLSAPRAPAAPGSAVAPRTMLAAGEQTAVTAQLIEKPRATDTKAATAWTEGLLVFDAAPLEEVVRQFNRHNLKPLVIEDDALRGLAISGVFPATGATRITAFLHDRFDVVVQETDDAIRISRR